MAVVQVGFSEEVAFGPRPDGKDPAPGKIGEPGGR